MKLFLLFFLFLTLHSEQLYCSVFSYEINKDDKFEINDPSHLKSSSELAEHLRNLKKKTKEKEDEIELKKENKNIIKEKIEEEQKENKKNTEKLIKEEAQESQNSKEIFDPFKDFDIPRINPRKIEIDSKKEKIEQKDTVISIDLEKYNNLLIEKNKNHQTEYNKNNEDFLKGININSNKKENEDSFVDNSTLILDKMKNSQDVYEINFLIKKLANNLSKNKKVKKNEIVYNKKLENFKINNSEKKDTLKSIGMTNEAYASESKINPYITSNEEEDKLISRSYVLDGSEGHILDQYKSGRKIKKDVESGKILHDSKIPDDSHLIQKNIKREIKEEFNETSNIQIPEITERLIKETKTQKIAPNVFKRKYDTKNSHLKTFNTFNDLVALAFIAVKEDNSRSKLNNILDQIKDPNIIDENGDTLLHKAVYFNKEDTVGMLILRGADPNILNKNGFSPLHLAASNGAYKIIYEIISSGSANLNIKDKEGNTPLMYAVTSNSLLSVNLLCSSGALINIKNNRSLNSLDIAKYINNESVFNYLEKLTYKI